MPVVERKLPWLLTSFVDSFGRINNRNDVVHHQNSFQLYAFLKRIVKQKCPDICLWLFLFLSVNLCLRIKQRRSEHSRAPILQWRNIVDSFDSLFLNIHFRFADQSRLIMEFFVN